MDYRKILPSFAACKHCIKLDEKTGEPRRMDGALPVSTGGSFFYMLMLGLVWLQFASHFHEDPRYRVVAIFVVGILGMLGSFWLIPSLFGVATHHLFWMFDGEKLGLHVHRRNPWKHELRSGLCQWLSWSYDGLPRTVPHIRGCILRIRNGAFFPRMLADINTVLWPDDYHFTPEVCGVASLRRVLIRSRSGDSDKYFGHATAAEALAMLNEYRDVAGWLDTLERRAIRFQIIRDGIEYVLEGLTTVHDRRKSKTGKWVVDRLSKLAGLHVGDADFPKGVRAVGELLEQKIAIASRHSAGAQQVQKSDPAA